MRLHDQGGCGGDYAARKRQLDVPVRFSTWRVGNQFQNGCMGENFSCFDVCIINCADHCNGDLFGEGKKDEVA